MATHASRHHLPNCHSSSMRLYKIAYGFLDSRVQCKLLQTVGAQLPESMADAQSSAIPRYLRWWHVCNIAIGSGPAGSAVGATPSASASISRTVLWAGAWMPGGVVG